METSMLDASDLDYRDVLAAVEAWQPDAACLAAGDEHALMAVRCFAAGGLSDRQITRRILHRLGVSTEIDTELGVWPYDAACAVARHAAVEGLPLRRIIAVLCELAVSLPGLPIEPNEIVAIARAAIAEFAT
jgi:hypothetical protein